VNGDSFISRWSRKKIEAKTEKATFGEAPAAVNAEMPNPSTGAPFQPKVPGEPPPEPGLPVETPPIESLTQDSDYAPFMQKDIAPGLRNQAMKKLFTDPHYNVMDRLDTYIDDYSVSEPIPLEILKQMNQAKFLGLFDEDKKAEQGEATPAAADETPPDKAASDDGAEPQAPNIPSDSGIKPPASK
jgi:hypothetical protein